MNYDFKGMSRDPRHWPNKVTLTTDGAADEQLLYNLMLIALHGGEILVNPNGHRVMIYTGESGISDGDNATGG